LSFGKKSGLIKFIEKKEKKKEKKGKQQEIFQSCVDYKDNPNVGQITAVNVNFVSYFSYHECNFPLTECTISGFRFRSGIVDNIHAL